MVEALALEKARAGLGVAAQAPQPLDQVAVSPHDVLVVVHVPGQLHAPQQVGRPGQVAELQPSRPDVVVAQGRGFEGSGPVGVSQLLLISSTYELPHLQTLVKHAMHRALTFATSVGIYGVSTLCNCRSLQIR